MSYLGVEEIEKLQLEPTSHCNLLCPRCSRTDNGQLNSRLPLADWSLSNYQKLLDQITHPKKLQEILFNGNYGDPAMSQSLMHGVQLLKQSTPAAIRIHSNGSLRSKAWWSQLGEALSDENDRLVFSIDGLEETNAIYRINSRFEKIMENATAFIESGGKARWDFLLFDHNKSDVEPAMARAKHMGFVEFNLKKTARPMPKEAEPTDRPESAEINETLNHYGSWKGYTKAAKIDCKFRQHVKGLFIDFLFRVWPCCWLAGPEFFADDEDPRRHELAKVLRRYSKGFNSLENHTLQEILEHPWLKQELIKSWNNSPDSHAKLRTCARMCGAEFEASSGANWANSNIIDL